MKRFLLQTKKFGTSKLLRKILSEYKLQENKMTEPQETEKNFEKESECTFLKEQISSLQQVVQSLQEELEAKDRTLATLNKEKDRLLIDLKKQKRSNLNLKQQLEDERAFYLKEKEYYCKEMSVSKKMRKKQHEESKNVEEIMEQIKETDDLRIEATKLKLVLNETLEANYNLSVKFLRMKNTKYSLKAKLKCEQQENAKIISDLTQKLQYTKDELMYVISDKFRQCIPPSNKRYLQVCKQNTQYIHENLNLQIQISKLYNSIERLKAEKIKFETNLKLQYARSLKLRAKNSSDKMCEANLCKECEKGSLLEKKSSDCTTLLSSGEKDSDVYLGRNFSVFPQNFGTLRTQSAPEFSMRNETTRKKKTPFEIPNT